MRNIITATGAVAIILAVIILSGLNDVYSEAANESDIDMRSSKDVSYLEFILSDANEPMMLSASSGTWKATYEKIWNYPGDAVLECRKWLMYNTNDTSEKITAYCIQPDLDGPAKATSASQVTTTVSTNSTRDANVKKILYYCYDYPGFEDYLANDIKSVMTGSKAHFKHGYSNYANSSMDYMISHILLAIAYYDDTSDDSKAFAGFRTGAGLSWASDYATDRANFRALYKKALLYPDPPEASDKVQLKRYGSDYAKTDNLSYSSENMIFKLDSEDIALGASSWEAKFTQPAETFRTPTTRVYCGKDDKVSVIVPTGGQIIIVKDAGGTNQQVITRIRGESELINEETGRTNLCNGDYFTLVFPAEYSSVYGKTYNQLKAKSLIGSYTTYKAKFGTDKQDIAFAISQSSVYALLSVKLPSASFTLYKFPSVKNLDSSSFLYNNPNYNLNGVQIKLSDTDGNSITQDVKTSYSDTSKGYSGYSETVSNLHYGRWKISEITGSEKGYKKDENEHTLIVTDSVTDSVKLKYSYDYGTYTDNTFFNVPYMVNGAYINIVKSDKDTGESVSQAGDSMAAVFKVSLFTKLANNQSLASGPSIVADNTPFKTWTVTCDRNGKASLAGENLPLGVITIEEVTPPSGYLKSSDIKVINLTESMAQQSENSTSSLSVSFEDTVKRGNLTFVKKDIKGTLMSNVLFKITNKSTGESHYIITDSSGSYDSKSRTQAALSAGTFAARKNKTDKAVTASGINTSYYDKSSFAWFGADAKESSVKTLPYGNYTIEEVPCPANLGYMLAQAISFSITDESQTVQLGTVTNSKVALSTKATVNATGKNYTYAAGTVTIKDTVTYSSAEKGKKYTLYTKLVNTKTGVQVGKVKTTEFIAGKTSGSTISLIDVPSDEIEVLKGEKVTVYENIYCEDSYGNFREVGAENNLSETNQQIVFLNPTCTTYLAEKESRSKNIFSDSTTLADTISYSGFAVGIEVTVTGYLVEKETGKKICDEISKKVTPTSESGSIQMEFPFSAKDYQGKKIVAYETVCYGSKVICEHKDINSDNQSVNVVKKYELPVTGGTDNRKMRIIVLLGLILLAGIYVGKKEKLG